MSETVTSGRNTNGAVRLQGSTAVPDRRTCKEIVSEAAVKAAEHRGSGCGLDRWGVTIMIWDTDQDRVYHTH